MQGNRLLELRRQEQEDRLAFPPAQPGFIVCPVELAPWQQQLYRAAYERACAVVAPWPPRWLEVSRN